MSRGTPQQRQLAARALRDERRRRVARLKLCGLSLGEVQAELTKEGCINPDTKEPWSLMSIHNDVEAIRAEWQEEMRKSRDQWITEEADKLKTIELEAMDAWRLSRGPGEEETTRTESDGAVSKRRKTTKQTGDPRLLAVALDAQARRAKLLGIDAPIKQEVAGGLTVEVKDFGTPSEGNGSSGP